MSKTSKAAQAVSVMLPTLFSRRSDGNIQTWQMEVSGSRYRVHSGVMGSPNLVTSAWTVATRKNVGRSNETSAEQQAALEAKAQWQKKRDRKYRESIDALPKNKSDAEKTSHSATDFFKVMLADKFEDRLEKGDVVFPVWSQPKLDGMRMIDFAHGPVSREGKPIKTADHVREALAKFREKFPNVALDGELYSDRLSTNFNKLMSIAKQMKPTQDDLRLSREFLRYHVYDVALLGDMPFSKRLEWLDLNLKPLLPKNCPVVLVRTTKVDALEKLDVLFAEYLEAGYEGQIVRLDMPYQNKRTKALLKRKNFIDKEFKIVRIDEGVGNRSGIAGRVTMCLPDGREFGTDPIGNVPYKRWLLQNAPAIIGQRGTVKFFQYTPDGIPRFGKLKIVRDYE